jgi:RNA polymerase-interacting CarD/CdnL/TRCF family regulator
MSGEENRVILTSGNKVIYPYQGPCLIGPVINKVIDGSPISFYRLALLDDSGGELFVPVDKVQTRGIRSLVKRSDVLKLLGQLRKTSEMAKDWKQRADDILRLFTSGSAFDLVEIVGSLTELSMAKALSLRESWMLARARTLLVCEISEVMGGPKSVAEEQVDQSLRTRKIAVVSGKPNYQPIGEFSHRYQAG